MSNYEEVMHFNRFIYQDICFLIKIRSKLSFEPCSSCILSFNSYLNPHMCISLFQISKLFPQRAIVCSNKFTCSNNYQIKWQLGSPALSPPPLNTVLKTRQPSLRGHLADNRDAGPVPGVPQIYLLVERQDSPTLEVLNRIIRSIIASES